MTGTTRHGDKTPRSAFSAPTISIWFPWGARAWRMQGWLARSAKDVRRNCADLAKKRWPRSRECGANDAFEVPAIATQIVAPMATNNHVRLVWLRSYTSGRASVA
jgi:hypothetical protein